MNIYYRRVFVCYSVIDFDVIIFLVTLHIEFSMYKLKKVIPQHFVSLTSLIQYNINTNSHTSLTSKFKTNGIYI